MLWIFDEAADAWGGASFFSDASVSLARQRLLRSGLWIWVVAGIAGIIPLIIAFGSFFRGTGPWVVESLSKLTTRVRQEGGILVKAVAEDCSQEFNSLDSASPRCGNYL